MNTYKMTLSDSVDSMTFDLLEVPIVDKDVEGAVDNTTLDGNIFTDYLWLKKNYVQKWSIMCDDEYSRLRGFYTRQFDNASVPTYKLFYGENISQDQAVSGDYILVNNPTEKNAPITSFDLLGDATQTTYSGKQLYNYTDLRTTGSFLVVGDDGWYTFTADRTNESSGNYYSFSTYNLALDYSTTYAIVTEIASVSITGAANITPADRWGQFETALFYNNPAVGTYVGTRTTKSAWGNTEGLASNIFVGAGSKATIKFRISVIADTSVTPTTFSYEPYVGGTASPNPDYPQAVNTVTGEQTVRITGKNLFDQSSDEQGSFNYITGILGNNNDRIRTLPIECFPNTEYTISANQSLGEWAVIYYAEDGTFIRGEGQDSITATSKTWTSKPDAKYMRIRLGSGSYPMTAGADYNIMLSADSTPQTYEPYQGQTLPVNLGKNLLQPMTGLTNLGLTGTTNADGTITVTGTATNTYAFITDTTTQNIPSGTYTFSDGLEGQTYRCIARFTYADNTYVECDLRNQGAGRSVTLAQTATKCQIRLTNITSGTTYNLTIKPQLELGSQPTSYSAYFTPIELAKIGNYQDRIYKDDGKWYIEKQVGKAVFNGSEAGWYYQDSGTNTNRFKISVSSYGLASGAEGLCNNNEFVPSGVSVDSQRVGIVSSVLYYRINKTTLASTTVADFKTWVASNNIIVYTALATPTTTEITNSELVGQLEAILQAYLYAGTNNISNGAVSPNLAGQMNLGYKLIFSEETVLIEPTAVRLTLTDGGIINICGCRQNVQLTMRETIQ